MTPEWQKYKRLVDIKREKLPSNLVATSVYWMYMN